jgi:hypothetical protein
MNSIITESINLAEYKTEIDNFNKILNANSDKFIEYIDINPKSFRWTGGLPENNINDVLYNTLGKLAEWKESPLTANIILNALNAINLDEVALANKSIYHKHIISKLVKDSNIENIPEEVFVNNLYLFENYDQYNKYDNDNIIGLIDAKKLSDEGLDKLMNSKFKKYLLNYIHFIKEQQPSQAFIEKHMDDFIKYKGFLRDISQYIKLDENFIKKYKNELDIYNLFKYQDLSDSLKKELQPIYNARSKYEKDVLDHMDRLYERGNERAYD